MKYLKRILLGMVAVLGCLSEGASAQTYQGTSSRGEIVNLYENSVEKLDRNNVRFTYSIGTDIVNAIANCSNGTIRSTNNSFPTYQPNPTGATRTMYNNVCDRSYGEFYSARPIQQVQQQPAYKRVQIINVFQGKVFSVGTGVVNLMNGNVISHDGYHFNMRDTFYWEQFQCVIRTDRDIYCVK